ncbi:hypothetical protein, partial [Dietzia cercidiphylli]|uniref:hypothetical protein n=1 Tax=Dietzia cercidiphylli TaxID=498199 RepID=UPI00223C4D33
PPGHPGIPRPGIRWRGVRCRGVPLPRHPLSRHLLARHPRPRLRTWNAFAHVDALARAPKCTPAIIARSG